MRTAIASLFLWLCCLSAFALKKEKATAVKISNAEIDKVLKQADAMALKKPDSIRAVAERMLVFSKQNNYRYGIGKSFNVIGLTYWVQSLVPVSQFYLVLAVPYLNGNKAALSDCYRNIARNYTDMKDYEPAKRYFMLSLKQAGKDVGMRAAIFTEMTSIFNATNDTANGLVHIKLAMRYAVKAAKDNLRGILYSRYAQIYIKQGKLSAAELMLDTAFSFAAKLNNNRLLSVATIDRSKVYLQRNDLKNSLVFAKKGFDLAETIGSSNLELRALKVLSDIYKKQGNMAAQAANHEKQTAIYDSVRNFSNRKTLQLIQDYDKLNGKLNDIEQVSRSSKANVALIKTQHRTIALLVTFLLVAVVFLFVIFIYYRQKNRLNNKLHVQHKELGLQKQLIEAQRADLQEVNKLKDKLLGIIGHDLRTPIANLSSIIDLFAEDYVTADEVKKLMLDIAPVVKGAELTLSNLMDFASGQIKGQTVSATNINLFLIAVEMKVIFEHQLQQKGIILNNNFDADISAWADANHVKVVLRNLLSNAIKFTGNNGQVSVSASLKEGMVTVCVRDTGVGMSQAEIEQLFKTNSHFSHSGTSGEKGTGLGLLLSKELVELNKGTIWAESDPGLGSKFCFTIPLAFLEI
ncbi:ATP-binding protein [Mucilaginibacter myungsuensis]|uniref:histidine kinase n=1 Tax=Mucilaginibacter myungsuensis TaxID=649104 RepID=A0A929PXY0_9SPHI|nr:ATP-binding protein [Mucilaginibacter myungsuensis]MBE9664323.1 hypothetical protein [Mucilaginibacter myungsuensis]MDN3597032.1 ATP-binding protein [Mucilaginibacter myungsuensis]